MSDFLTMMLLNRTRGNPLGGYDRTPKAQGAGVSVESGVRFGRIVDGREIDVTSPPTDPYHKTAGLRDGWFFEEVYGDTLGIRTTEETAPDGVTYLRPADHMCWFPLAEGQIVAFLAQYFVADGGWKHTLLWPDYSNVWRMQQVAAVAGGTAGTLIAAPSQVYDVLDNSFGGIVLLEDLTPMNNRTQYGKRIGIGTQYAMVCWTALGTPDNCLIYLPAELRSWRADCP